MAERNIIELKKLRPTQMTVGMLQVAHKRKKLRELVKRPAELVEFIIARPICIVLGPKGNAYVIDHHHLGLALIRENYETAPMDVADDFSGYTLRNFWKKMEALHFVHPYDANGKPQPLADLPAKMTELKDDIYRSLAGFVREAGGYDKVPTPFAEFLWADYFRAHISKKHVIAHFHKALEHALKLAHHPEASYLPGFKRKKA